MRLLLRAGRWLLGAAVVASVASACFSAGGGNTPPTNILYFPTGLAVSAGGTALYVVNSDFDLQWNGGTLQSYDLGQIRKDADQLVNFNTIPGSPFPDLPWAPGFHVAATPCINAQPVTEDNSDTVEPGKQCAPPVDSTVPFTPATAGAPAHGYFHDAVIVGAFATDLQLGMAVLPGAGGAMVPAMEGANADPADAADAGVPDGDAGAVDAADAAAVDASELDAGGLDAADAGGANTDAPAGVSPVPAPVASGRLLFPVRGTATLTYADVGNDQVPGAQSPFALECNAQSDQRCAADHQAGSNPNEPGNSRGLTMPGYSFGMALTEDRTAVAITHQTDTKTSLLKTGIGSPPPSFASMQFVLDGLPTGGNGIVAIPHDPDAVSDARTSRTPPTASGPPSSRRAATPPRSICSATTPTTARRCSVPSSNAKAPSRSPSTRSGPTSGGS